MIYGNLRFWIGEFLTAAAGAWEAYTVSYETGQTNYAAHDGSITHTSADPSADGFTDTGGRFHLRNSGWFDDKGWHSYDPLHKPT